LVLLEHTKGIALRLVTSNRDKPGASIVVLGVGPKDSENLKFWAALWFITDNDTSSLESEDSEYVDDEVKTDDERFKHVSVENLSESESDKARNEDKVISIGYGNLSENGFDEGERKDSEKSFVEMEFEIDDEDVRSLGMQIMDIDNDNDISNFLL